jgi:hypothetical protein
VENIWVLKEEASSGWRKLPYEELQDLCFLDMIRYDKGNERKKDEMDGA